MGREALHGALRELISVAVLWYEDDLLASDQGDAVNVVHGVLLGGRQYRAAYDLWNLRDHSVAALLQAVCPFGNPIAHSYVAGMIRPVSPALYSKVAKLGEFRSEEHTSELQSLMRISYAVFCLKKKNK